jgi:molecular chaperone DnaJ
VNVNVWIPKNVSKEERSIIEKFEQSANFKPTPGKSDKNFFSRIKQLFV